MLVFIIQWVLKLLPGVSLTSCFTASKKRVEDDDDMQMLAAWAV